MNFIGALLIPYFHIKSLYNRSILCRGMTKNVLKAIIRTNSVGMLSNKVSSGSSCHCLWAGGALSSGQGLLWKEEDMIFIANLD